MIELKNIPQVALACLNEDHQEVANLLNQLDVQLKEPASSNVITQQLAQLLSHIENHFACEEHQMNKYQFPALPIHRQEHQRVLAELLLIQEAWLANESTDALSQYLVNTFNPWLVEHITTLDTQTAQFIVDAGGS